MYLIAHTNQDGTGVAQAKIAAETENEAKSKFARIYPDRVITQVGIEGVE
jgi:hypothetical protein